MRPNVRTSKYLTLSEAAQVIPGRPHTSSLWRACRKGVLGRNGERIYLGHYRWGRRIFTTREDIEQYVQALQRADAEHFNEPQHSECSKSPHRSNSQRQNAIDRAETDLQTGGFDREDTQ